MRSVDLAKCRAKRGWEFAPESLANASVDLVLNVYGKSLGKIARDLRVKSPHHHLGIFSKDRVYF